MQIIGKLGIIFFLLLPTSGKQVLAQRSAVKLTSCKDINSYMLRDQLPPTMEVDLGKEDCTLQTRQHRRQRTFRFSSFKAKELRFLSGDGIGGFAANRIIISDADIDRLTLDHSPGFWFETETSESELSFAPSPLNRKPFLMIVSGQVRGLQARNSNLSKVGISDWAIFPRAEDRKAFKNLRDPGTILAELSADQDLASKPNVLIPGVYPDGTLVDFDFANLTLTKDADTCKLELIRPKFPEYSPAAYGDMDEAWFTGEGNAERCMFRGMKRKTVWAHIKKDFNALICGGEQCPDKQDFSNRDFSGWDLSQVIMPKANYTGSRFTGANLSGADLTHISPEDLCKDGKCVRGQFQSVRFYGAKMTCAVARVLLNEIKKSEDYSLEDLTPFFGLEPSGCTGEGFTKSVVDLLKPIINSSIETDPNFGEDLAFKIFQGIIPLDEKLVAELFAKLDQQDRGREIWGKVRAEQVLAQLGEGASIERRREVFATFIGETTTDQARESLEKTYRDQVLPAIMDPLEQHFLDTKSSLREDENLTLEIFWREASFDLSELDDLRTTLGLLKGDVVERSARTCGDIPLPLNCADPSDRDKRDLLETNYQFLDNELSEVNRLYRQLELSRDHRFLTLADLTSADPADSEKLTVTESRWSSPLLAFIQARLEVERENLVSRYILNILAHPSNRSLEDFTMRLTRRFNAMSNRVHANLETLREFRRENRSRRGKQQQNALHCVQMDYYEMSAAKEEDNYRKILEDKLSMLDQQIQQGESQEKDLKGQLNDALERLNELEVRSNEAEAALDNELKIIKANSEIKDDGYSDFQVAVDTYATEALCQPVPENTDKGEIVISCQYQSFTERVRQAIDNNQYQDLDLQEDFPAFCKTPLENPRDLAIPKATSVTATEIELYQSAGEEKNDFKNRLVALALSIEVFQTLYNKAVSNPTNPLYGEEKLEGEISIETAIDMQNRNLINFHLGSKQCRLTVGKDFDVFSSMTKSNSPEFDRLCQRWDDIKRHVIVERKFERFKGYLDDREAKCISKYNQHLVSHDVRQEREAHATARTKSNKQILESQAKRLKDTVKRLTGHDCQGPGREGTYGEEFRCDVPEDFSTGQIKVQSDMIDKLRNKKDQTHKEIKFLNGEAVGESFRVDFENKRQNRSGPNKLLAKFYRSFSKDCAAVEDMAAAMEDDDLAFDRRLFNYSRSQIEQMTLLVHGTAQFIGKDFTSKSRYEKNLKNLDGQWKDIESMLASVTDLGNDFKDFTDTLEARGSDSLAFNRKWLHIPIGQWSFENNPSDSRSIDSMAETPKICLAHTAQSLVEKVEERLRWSPAESLSPRYDFSLDSERAADGFKSWREINQWYGRVARTLHSEGFGSDNVNSKTLKMAYRALLIQGYQRSMERQKDLQSRMERVWNESGEPVNYKLAVNISPELSYLSSGMRLVGIYPSLLSTKQGKQDAHPQVFWQTTTAVHRTAKCDNLLGLQCSNFSRGSWWSGSQYNDNFEGEGGHFDIRTAIDTLTLQNAEFLKNPVGNLIGELHGQPVDVNGFSLHVESTSEPFIAGMVSLEVIYSSFIESKTDPIFSYYDQRIPIPLTEQADQKLSFYYQHDGVVFNGYSPLAWAIQESERRLDGDIEVDGFCGPAVGMKSELSEDDYFMGAN